MYVEIGVWNDFVRLRLCTTSTQDEVETTLISENLRKDRVGRTVASQLLP